MRFIGTRCRVTPQRAPPLESQLGWGMMIGPGKAFDTDKYFVICSNVIGGCQGSTGPSSLNPRTGKPYGLSFPVVTIGDMVRAQRHLIDYLGIEKLLAIAGGSMGGMQVLEWAVSYPERVCAALPLATTAHHSPMLIALSEVGRQAIYADPTGMAVITTISRPNVGRPSPACGRSLLMIVMQQKFERRLPAGAFG